MSHNGSVSVVIPNNYCVLANGRTMMRGDKILSYNRKWFLSWKYVSQEEAGKAVTPSRVVIRKMRVHQLRYSNTSKRTHDSVGR